MARTCPVCGKQNSACGPSTSTNGINIVRPKKEATMSQLSSYTFVNERGQAVTLRLTEEDAKARGLTEFRDGYVRETAPVPDPAHGALAIDLEASQARVAELEAQLAIAEAAAALAAVTPDVETTGEPTAVVAPSTEENPPVIEPTPATTPEPTPTKAPAQKSPPAKKATPANKSRAAANKG